MPETADWDELVTSLGLKPSSRQARPDAVRAAGTARNRSWRQRVAGTLAPDDPRHGTPGGYTNWGCRCDLCTAANTDNCTPRVAASRARRKATT